MQSSTSVNAMHMLYIEIYVLKIVRKGHPLTPGQFPVCVLNKIIGGESDDTAITRSTGVSMQRTSLYGRVWSNTQEVSR